MAARQWTDEQRKAQAEKIRTYQPWQMSTAQPVRQVKRLSLKMRLKRESTQPTK